MGAVPDVHAREVPDDVALKIDIPTGPVGTRSSYTDTSRAFMFMYYRPVAAVLAALATSAVFVFLDFLFRYATQ
jgi:hypothetical protein